MGTYDKPGIIKDTRLQAARGASQQISKTIAEQAQKKKKAEEMIKLKQQKLNESMYGLQLDVSKIPASSDKSLTASLRKTLNTELLYSRARIRLKIPRKGLLYIIQLLFNRKILVEGSKFTQETILSNTIRKRIYSFIKTHIGAHFSLIRERVLSVDRKSFGSPGQLIWHLGMLVKFNYIKKLKVGNFTIFLPIEIDDEFGMICFLINDELNKKIVNLLLEYDTIKKADAYKLLNEKRELVYYRINKLIEQNIIYSVEEGNKLNLNPHIKEIVLQILKDISE